MLRSPKLEVPSIYCAVLCILLIFLGLPPGSNMYEKWTEFYYYSVITYYPILYLRGRHKIYKSYKIYSLSIQVSEVDVKVRSLSWSVLQHLWTLPPVQSAEHAKDKIQIQIQSGSWIILLHRNIRLHSYIYNIHLLPTTSRNNRLMLFSSSWQELLPGVGSSLSLEYIYFCFKCYIFIGAYWLYMCVPCPYIQHLHSLHLYLLPTTSSNNSLMLFCCCFSSSWQEFLPGVGSSLSLEYLFSVFNVTYSLCSILIDCAYISVTTRMLFCCFAKVCNKSTSLGQGQLYV